MALLRVQVKICLPRDMKPGKACSSIFASQLFMSHSRRAGMPPTMTSGFGGLKLTGGGVAVRTPTAFIPHSCAHGYHTSYRR